MQHDIHGYLTTDYDFGGGGDGGDGDDDDDAWEHFQEPLPEGALGNIQVPKADAGGVYVLPCFWWAYVYMYESMYVHTTCV
jgi:hypothetical protein